MVEWLRASLFFGRRLTIPLRAIEVEGAYASRLYPFTLASRLALS